MQMVDIKGYNFKLRGKKFQLSHRALKPMTAFLSYYIMNKKAVPLQWQPGPNSKSPGL
jgi:hypothetical protein